MSERFGTPPPALHFLRGLVGERHGPVWTFMVMWALVMLVPLVGLVVWSFLTIKGFRVSFDPNVDAYLNLFESGRWSVTVRTLRIAATVTAIELLLALPFALWLAKGTQSAVVRAMTLALLTVPFFLSVAARTIVWRAVLGTQGFVNSALIWLGLIDEPLDWLLFSEFAVHLGLIGPYFPTMVFPIFLAAVMIDDELLAASRDLGGGTLHTLVHVILPLVMPGIIAGIVFTFVPMLGADVIPALLGGGHAHLLGNSVHSLLTALNYAVASAMSTVILFAMVALLFVLRLLMLRLGGFGEVFEGLKR